MPELRVRYDVPVLSSIALELPVALVSVLVPLVVPGAPVLLPDMLPVLFLGAVRLLVFIPLDVFPVPPACAPDVAPPIAPVCPALVPPDFAPDVPLVVPLLLPDDAPVLPVPAAPVPALPPVWA